MTPKYPNIETYIRQNPTLSNLEVGQAWLTPSDEVAKIRNRIWWEDIQRGPIPVFSPDFLKSVRALKPYVEIEEYDPPRKFPQYASEALATVSVRKHTE